VLFVADSIELIQRISYQERIWRLQNRRESNSHSELRNDLVLLAEEEAVP